MKLSRDAWLLVGMGVLLAVTVVLVLTQGRSDDDSDWYPRHSSRLTTPAGLHALYQTLKQMNYRTLRLTTPVGKDTEDGLVFSVGQEHDAKAWAGIQRWIAKGNVYVYAPRRGRTLSARLDTSWMPLRLAEPSEWPRTAPNVMGLKDTEVLDPLMWFDECACDDTDTQDDHSAAHDRGVRQVVVLTPLYRLQGIESGMNRSVPVPPRFRVGLQQPTLASIGVARYGRGLLVVLSSGWLLSNAGIGRGDNMRLVMQWLYLAGVDRGNTVLFDDGLYGRSQAEGPFSLLNGSAKAGLALLALAFLLLLIASRRFGRVIPVPPEPRRREEYLGSLAALLRRTHSITLVHGRLSERFLNDVRGALVLDRHAGVSDILDAIAMRRPELLDLMTDLCRDTTAPVENDHQLLMLAKRWHRMKGELRR